MEEGNENEAQAEEDEQEDDGKLYCICKQPYTQGEDMVACDLCEDWFHGECIDLDLSTLSEDEPWYCPSCLAKQQRQTRWSHKAASGALPLLTSVGDTRAAPDSSTGAHMVRATATVATTATGSTAAAAIAAFAKVAAVAKSMDSSPTADADKAAALGLAAKSAPTLTSASGSQSRSQPTNGSIGNGSGSGSGTIGHSGKITAFFTKFHK
jgi:hypothetical protein